MQEVLKPKLTVAVSVYNAEKYIDQCIQSLLDQTFTDYEILLMDSESPDRCGEICRQYAEKYPFIQYVKCKNSGDASNSRNVAMDIAKGEYITFIDSDDIVDKDMYSTMVGHMEKDSLDAVYCTCYRFFNDDLSTKSIRNIREVFCENREEIVEKMILPLMSGLEPGFEVTVSMCMTVYRTDIIRKNNLKVLPLKEIYSEDTYFNMQYLAISDRARTINQPFYYYRKNMASVTNIQQSHNVSAMKYFAEQVAKLAEGMGVSSTQISLRTKTKFIINYSAIVRQIMDGMSFKAAKKQISAQIAENGIDLTFTKQELSCVEMQVKLFWILMRYRLYTPLYLLVKVYSRFVAR